MGWFNSAVHAIGKVGNQAVHTVESGAKTVASGVTTAANTVAGGVTTAANTVADGVTTGVDAAGHAVATVGTTIGDVAVTGADEVASGVTTAANTIAKGASQGFDAAVHAGEVAFDDVKHALETALEEGEAKILGPAAEHVVKELKDEINALRRAFSAVSGTMANEIGIIRSAAMSRQVSSRAVASFGRVAKELGTELAPFFSKSYASFGLEFGASAALGVGGEVALGVIGGLPNITDVRGYGSVGVSVGVEEGAEADVALVLNFSAPEDSGGGYVSVIVSLEVEAGGTVIVSYNLPDFSLGGISIGLGAGEELGVAIGGGYSFVF